MVIMVQNHFDTISDIFYYEKVLVKPAHEWASSVLLCLSYAHLLSLELSGTERTEIHCRI